MENGGIIMGFWSDIKGLFTDTILQNDRPKNMRILAP